MSIPRPTITKTYTLSPNETWTIPPNATITAITGFVEDPCDVAPDPTELGCYFFKYEIEGADEGTDAWENAFAEALIVGDTSYNLGNYNMYLHTNYAPPPLPPALPAAGNTGIKTLLENTKTIFNTTFDDPDHWLGGLTIFVIRFKTFPALAQNMYLKLKTGQNTVALFPATSYDCEEGN